ncbi:MAG: acyl-ACP thioesterase domain-containing protein [Bacteroidota bacterium]
MKNHSLIHTEQGSVKGYDVDLFQRATIPAMVFKMHESAMQQVMQLGVSAKELVTQNLGWVLVQQYFEFFRQPQLGEKITIQTYPTGKARVFTYRDFQTTDERGAVLARASSSWLLMDIQARKMVMRYPENIDAMLRETEDFEKLPRPPAMKFKIKNPDYQSTYRVGFHDLDFNAHLSNFFYFRWMLDTLPNKFLKENQLKTLNMRFKEECYMDDEVKVLIQKVDEKKMLHVMMKQEKILAEAMTRWK